MSHSELDAQATLRLPQGAQLSHRPPVDVAMRQTLTAGQPALLPGVVQVAPPLPGRSRSGSRPLVEPSVPLAASFPPSSAALASSLVGLSASAFEAPSRVPAGS